MGKVKPKRLNYRFMRSRKCALKCKGCYLDTVNSKDNAIKEFPIDLTNLEYLNISHYINSQTHVENTMLLIAKDLQDIWIRFPNIGTKHKLSEYTLVIDVNSFYQIYRKDYLHKILPRNHTISLSYKSRSDKEKVREIIENYNSSFMLLYVEGIDSEEILDHMKEMVLKYPDKDVDIVYMFEKPITFTNEIYNRNSKVLLDRNIQYNDICIDKCAKGFDCTKYIDNSVNPVYIPVITHIMDEGYYFCTYPSNTCLVKKGEKANVNIGN